MSRSFGARRRLGQVRSFDEVAGYGVVVEDRTDGDEWFFHCTRIADGSRRIEEGTAVAFALTPGHLGRWEADDLQPI